MATKLPTVKNGDTWKFSFVWSNSDGSAMNLTGCTAKMQIKDTAGAVVATASSALNSITIVYLTGTVNVVFSATITGPIAAGLYKSDLQLTFADGTVQSSSTVIITVEAGITE
jgi:hypothetical protein